MNAPATQNQVQNQVQNPEQTWIDFVDPWEREFTEKNAYGLNFKAEQHFAIQLLMKNDTTVSTARQNPQSLHNALLNVAAIGISLNPALKHAYLVPRDGAICLDMSYKGLIKLACHTGAIIAAKAELVHGPRGQYQGDLYKWRGPFLPPEHDAEAFHPDRINGDDPLENIIGGYCVAVLPSQTMMVEQMSAAEIFSVRNTSKAYHSVKNKGPWVGPWSGQMGKKTLVKRGSNSWPQTSGRERLDMAIDILNQHEGLREIHSESAPANQLKAEAPPPCITHQQSDDLLNAIKVAGITTEKFCKMAGINEITNLAADRFAGAKARLQQIAQRPPR